MIVTALDINIHLSDTLKIQQFKMKGLNQLVILTGANGCGKTRLLSSLDWLLHHAHRNGYSKTLKELKRLESPAELVRKNLKSLSGDPEKLYLFRQKCEMQFAKLQILSGAELKFGKKEVEDEILKSYIAISEFLKRPLEYTRSHVAALSIGVPRDIADLSSTGLLSSPLSYLSDICARLTAERAYKRKEGKMAVHSVYPGIEQSFLELHTLVTSLLCMSLGCDKTLNAIPLESITLSQGQAQLLRWVVLLHSGVLRKVSVPLLLDEPELHLHPDALNRLLDQIITNAPNCQIWLATHSISLIAHLAAIQPRSVWFGSEGKFTNAGKDLPRVVEALLGGEGGSEKLVDYCVSAERFAFNSFATDCLLPPLAVSYKPGDPQIKQVFEFIRDKNSLRLNLLDFGAGQGRLLDGIVAEASDRGKKHTELVSYYAYEPFKDSLPHCMEVVSAHYKDAIKRVFSDSKDIRASSISFDLVVMANLLHEIPPLQWISDIFQGDIIQHALKPQGHVLLIEDTLLPTGELAHNCGFLILEQSALELLFKVTGDDRSSNRFVTRTSLGERLQATLISQELFLRVDHASMIDALELQYEKAILAIKELRSDQGNKSYMSGRKHAYLTQLATNVKLAIEEILPFVPNSLAGVTTNPDAKMPGRSKA
jgi:energy-coupling factor transporter ATP-binding protein EcfA2